MRTKALTLLLTIFFLIWTNYGFTDPQKEEGVKIGIASWYGGGEKLNKYTASGEEFDPNKLTCASWDYSFGTKLLVTNLENGKSVVVRVNDRGPAKRLGRLIDLTREAFRRIADLKKGLIKVKVKVLKCG